MRVFVTGGAGFIGSAVIRHLIRKTGFSVLNYDKLTYAANLAALEETVESPRYQFVQGDICDAGLLSAQLAQYKPQAILHLAAETHVDRSISEPAAFIRTNVLGTQTLLDASLAYWRGLTAPEQAQFRFQHISTDEVFGALALDARERFSETTAYHPNSPYAASKAASDHLVRAWHKTYGLPILITNCSNNYGPWQDAEKLIPHMVLKALAGQPLPVYGDGLNIRDWLFVDDHVAALLAVLASGRVGETYVIGGGTEIANIDLVRSLCRILDKVQPGDAPYERLITYVTDRPGHDRRYAVDSEKIRGALGWRPEEDFETGLGKTIAWYCAHQRFFVKTI